MVVVDKRETTLVVFGTFINDTAWVGDMLYINIWVRQCSAILAFHSRKDGNFNSTSSIPSGQLDRSQQC